MLANIGANIVSVFFFACELNQIDSLIFYNIEGVRAKVYFKALPQPDVENNLTFLTVDQVKMDFSVKDIRMGVENISNGNVVIRKLFLNCFDF